MYNLRYHIASLAAVFLALAMGLVLGGLAVGRGALDNQQQSLVEGLRKEFSALRTQNADLSAANEMLSEFARQSNDAWARGRLQGKSMMILAGSGRTDGVQAAQRDLEDAGATVVTVTLIKPGFGLDDAAVRARVESLTGTRQDLAASVAASLAAEWRAGIDGRPLTDLLLAEGVISASGIDDGVTVFGVLDLASIDGEHDPSALAVARAFADAGGTAVGAQTTNAGTGVAAAAADAGLSAFDTLGTQVGRFTLVALFSGGEPGYYGYAAGTKAPFPPIPGTD